MTGPDYYGVITDRPAPAGLRVVSYGGGVQSTALLVLAAQRRCRPPNPATVAIGISLDEIHRANTRRVEPHERITYPLLDARLRRSDCLRIIAEAGLPIPGKSSCFFCPLHTPAAWADQARDEPALFARSCQLEELLNARRGELGKDPVFLTRFATPLAEAVGTGQDLLPFDDGGCDSGWCMT